MPTNGPKMTPVKRPQVPKEVVRPGPAGKDWCGYPHKKLLDQVAAELTTLVGQPTDEKVWVSPGGRDMVVRFSLPPDCFQVVEEYGVPTVWVTHSNNRRRSLKFFLGVEPTTDYQKDCFVVTDVIDPVPKFTAGVDVPNVVHSSVVRLVEKGRDDLFEHLGREFVLPITSEARDRILMEAGRNGILPWSKIGKVYTEVTSYWDLAVEFGVQLATESPWHVPEQGLLFWRLLGETVKAGETARAA